MNWEIFSITGYLSVTVWLCMPVLWLLHWARRPRRWLCHVALLLGVVAFGLAKVNSLTYVNRIQVDRSAQIEEQMARQAMARQAAERERGEEVAAIRFAEDASGDFLDKAGLDEADLKYFESFDEPVTPEWKKQKKTRSTDGGEQTDDLEALIGASDQRKGMSSRVPIEDQAFEPILMSDEDKTAADRLDAANLTIIPVMLGLAVVILAVDYFRRMNVYEEAYCPLPFPSTWADALTERPPVTVRSTAPRRSLLEDLRVIVRRGEVFVYMTEDANAAAAAARAAMPRLPGGFRPVPVLDVTDDEKMDDDFVFETLWFGRSCFVVDSAERAQTMLERIIELMIERRSTRARARQAVHIVWDIAAPVPEQMKHRFAALGRATGLVLLLCRSTEPEKITTEGTGNAEVKSS